jgi:hypothetical protein
MNEAQFTQKIHRKLSSEVYKWKISDRFTAGIPDAYYSGNKDDLWVEYKFEKEGPHRRFMNLSALQKNWLKSRHSEGRNVAAIQGYEDGSAIIKEGVAWELPLNPIDKVPLDDVVKYIEGIVCEQ